MTAAEFKAGLAARGVTQAAFARRYRLSPVTVWRWCRGDLAVPVWAAYALREVPRQPDTHKTYGGDVPRETSRDS